MRDRWTKLLAWMRSPAGESAAALLCLILFVCYLAFQVFPLLDDRGTGVPGIASHQNDFKHLYLGSELLGEGLSPYESQNMLGMAGSLAGTEDPRFRTILPYVYLPFTGLVLQPLTWFEHFHQAVVAWQILNHLFVLGGLALAGWASGWPRSFWSAAGLLALVAFDFALYRQNNAGQLNAALFFGMALLWLGIVRCWHPAVIGFIAAFLMLFKLSPGIFLVYFLLRRDWRRVGWMIGWAAGLGLLAVLVFGFQVHREFLPVLAQMGYGKSTWAEFGHTFWRDPYNQSFNALFHRVFVESPNSGVSPWLGMGPAVANGLTWLVSFGLLGGFIYTLWKKPRLAGAGEAAPFSAAVSLSLLLPSIMWDHYTVQLLLPLIVLVPLMARLGRPVFLYGLLIGSAVLIFLPIQMDAEAFRSGIGLLVMNAKLLPAVVLFGLSVYTNFKMDSEQ